MQIHRVQFLCYTRVIKVVLLCLLNHIMSSSRKHANVLTTWQLFPKFTPGVYNGPNTVFSIMLSFKQIHPNQMKSPTSCQIYYLPHGVDKGVIKFAYIIHLLSELFGLSWRRLHVTWGQIALPPYRQNTNIIHLFPMFFIAFSYFHEEWHSSWTCSLISF